MPTRVKARRTGRTYGFTVEEVRFILWTRNLRASVSEGGNCRKRSVGARPVGPPDGVQPEHDWHESFTSFHHYGLYGLLITWIGGLPLSVSTALLVRRTSVWILAPCLVWFLLVAMVFLVLVGATAPGGGVKMGFGGVSHDHVLVTVLVRGVLLSAGSIPIWLCSRSANLRWIFTG